MYFTLETGSSLPEIPHHVSSTSGNSFILNSQKLTNHIQRHFYLKNLNGGKDILIMQIHILPGNIYTQIQVGITYESTARFQHGTAWSQSVDM